MGYQTASPEDVDSVLPDDAGGMWFLKDALGTEEIGFTILELEPGVSGKEHSHGGQEEVYYVVEGGVTVEIGDETVSLAENEAIRIDPDDSRQIVNGDERSRLVLVGAPRSAD